VSPIVYVEKKGSAGEAQITGDIAGGKQAGIPRGNQLVESGRIRALYLGPALLGTRKDHSKAKHLAHKQGKGMTG